MKKYDKNAEPSVTVILSIPFLAKISNTAENIAIKTAYTGFIFT